WQRLLAAYKAVAVRPLSIAEHVEVRMRLGALYRQHLGDVERALATFGRVLDLAPDDARANQAIDELYALAGRWGELAARLRESAEAVAGLERLFAAGVARQRVAALLMPRYREAGRAADLVRIWTAAYVDAPDAQPLADLVALARSAGELPSLVAQ